MDLDRVAKVIAMLAIIVSLAVIGVASMPTETAPTGDAASASH